MNIDDEALALVDKLRSEKNPFHMVDSSLAPLEIWIFSSGMITWCLDLVDTKEEEAIVRTLASGKRGQVEDAVIDLIRNTDAAECLTSNIKFIRDCKQWMIKNEKPRRSNKRSSGRV